MTTTVPSCGITRQMADGYLVPAVYRDCSFNPKPSCHFSDWQYHPPQGLRNDRPLVGSHLIFAIQPTCDTEIAEDDIFGPDATGCFSHEEAKPMKLKIQAPEGEGDSE
jgi:hypothetical protein